MKQIDFCLLFLLSLIIFSTAFFVNVRFIASAPCLEISSTEWFAYKACAASTIVGVGLYEEFNQLFTSKHYFL